jgi:hypothetical protein
MGNYRFQQIRDQNYDFAICLGLSPFDAHCWTIPKAELMQSEGRDTSWLTINPADAYVWLGTFGGRLGDAARVLARLARRR